MTVRVTSRASDVPPLRREQANAVRERILEATLRVIEDGAEPTMRAVAQAAEIAERTLYRYFATRDELNDAVVPRISARASAPMAKDVGGLPAYLRALFTTFDANARLTRALVHATWAPTNVSRPKNLAALRAIIDAAHPKAPAAERASAAASLRVLYSAASWAYLADCGFDLEASIRHVEWNTRVVLAELRRTSRGQHA